MESRVFLSYSHADAVLARSVVELLRARDDVFFDVDSIRAGRRWRDAISEAIQSAALIYVLWCAHSATSAEVLQEMKQAVRAGKPVVPVLLDSTPLVEFLDGFHWVDLGHVVMHETPMEPRAARDAATVGPSRLAWLLVVAALLVVSSLAVVPSAVPADAWRPALVWIVLGVGAAWWMVRQRRTQPSPATLASADESEAIAEWIAGDLRRRR